MPTKSSSSKPSVIVTCDGASKGNPGRAGFGIVLRDDKTGAVKEIAGNRDRLTNNEAELLAAIVALAHLTRPSQVVIRTDSKYVVDGFNTWIKDWIARGWKTSSNKPVANREMWEYLLQRAQPHEVTFEHVAGHAGDPDNETANTLAQNAAAQTENSPKLGWTRRPVAQVAA